MNIIPVTLRHILPCICYIVHFEMTKLLLQFTIWHNANIHMSLPSSKLFYGYKKFNMTSLDIVNIDKGLENLAINWKSGSVIWSGLADPMEKKWNKKMQIRISYH